MTFASKRPASLALLRVKIALVCGTPILAAAADAVQHAAGRGSISAVSAWTWGFLIGFAMLGWAVSELDKVAELWNTDGRSQYEIWKERLKLLKGIAAANAAGILVYFLGSASPWFFLRALGVQTETPPELPEMVLFVFVSGAGYMGVRWFAWLEVKFFGAKP